MQNKPITQEQNENPKFWTTKRKVIIVIIALLVLFCVIDYIDGPMFWQTEAYENKQVILNYVSEKYPDEDLRIVKQKYYVFSLASSKPYDVIVFKTNKGFNFAVSARDGELCLDGYENAQAKFQINDIIKEFTGPRKLSPEISTFLISNGTSSSGSKKNVRISSFFGEQPIAYYQAEWLYDYYLFWVENSCFSDYIFVISYEFNGDRYNMVYYSNSDVLDKQSFYSSFTKKPRG